MPKKRYVSRKYLDENNIDIDLIITGGLRISSDFAKAIAMGADAIAIGTAAMIAIACQQYRVCNTGMCPVGIGTQREDLRGRLKIDACSQRLANYLNVVNGELKTAAGFLWEVDKELKKNKNKLRGIM